MGSSLISLKGQSLTWMGQSTLSVSDRGQRRFLRLRNCYVSPDGSEIRSFPGFYGLWDNSEAANPNGWAGRYTTDVVRPIYRTNPNDTYQYGYTPSGSADAALQTLVARAKPTHYHGFEQVGSVLVVWGESRFREVPIFGAGRAPLTPTFVSIDANVWKIQLSGALTSATLSDVTGASLNAINAANQDVYIEGLRSNTPAIQTILDAQINGKVHSVASFAGSTLTLTSLSATTTLGLSAVSDGTVHIVRPNRDGTYPTASGTQLTPYGTTPLNQVDDPDALTAWRILDPLGDPNDTRKVCHPSWVANRRRDCGDKIQAGYSEGVQYGVLGRWASRREQRPLPYRTNSDAATDRVLLAAPGYGCMFQVPLKVPTNPAAWPDNQADGSLGLPLAGNSIYDAPRSLGIPKARMIVGVDARTSPPPSPSASPPSNGWNPLAAAIPGSSAVNGFAEGEWKIAIAYEDEGTGEEGLASDTGTVNIPTGAGTAYALAIHYIHPGYIMPECLATRVNVYLAPPGRDALAFYDSFPLSANPRVLDTANSATSIPTNFNTSGYYGFQPAATAGATPTIHRTIQLNVLGNSADVAESLDESRLAPQSASMPRGAEAVRYLRGVSLAGGNLGNVGLNGALWYAQGSVRFEPLASYDRDNEFLIRVHGNQYTAQSATQDGPYGTSSLGTAGRCFPDAYSGVEVVSRDLFPSGSFYRRIDQVGNRRTNDITAVPAAQHLQEERISVTRPFLNRSRDVLTAPSTVVTTATGPQNLFYVMPKGQMQIGDPGAPWRASKAAIQFVDANRGDDISAIGNVAGTAIVCTMRETYSFAWYRNPGGEIPNLVSNEHGCIAANSMVEFDGGCAWLGERGPVAMGNGLQFIGLDVMEDFTNETARYLRDSKGMMRHSWGCHDAGRGLVMWGLVTAEGAQTVAYRGGPARSYQDSLTSDEARSRFPCDEVLIWSYRTSTFSTWRPPAGLEILWMRPIRTEDGDMVIAFLAADGRIYALSETHCDSGVAQDYVLAQDYAPGAQISVSFPSWPEYSSVGLDGVLQRFRTGMRVEQFRDDRIIGEGLFGTLVILTATTATFTLSTPIAWKKGDTIRIGARPVMDILNGYLGAETMGTLSCDAVQVRYSLLGAQDGQARITAQVTSHDTHDTISMGPWEPLGLDDNVSSIGEPRLSARKEFSRGKFDRPEAAIRFQYSGKGQIRIADIGLEVG